MEYRTSCNIRSIPDIRSDKGCDGGPLGLGNGDRGMPTELPTTLTWRTAGRVGDHQFVLWVFTAYAHVRSFYVRNGWVCDQRVEHHVYAWQSMPVVCYSLARPLQQQ
jgi:hypothetical protein